MIDSLRGIPGMGMFVLAGALSVGCGFVGFKYSYRGHEYTMTEPNREYHQTAIRDVYTRFGSADSQHDIAKLKGACELLRKYSAEAPDPGSFTSARDLLDGEATSTCHRWEQRDAEERAKADHRRRDDENRREHAAREHQRDEEKRTQERDRLASNLERDQRLLTACDSTEAARTARKRHADILQRGAGVEVRKGCSPRYETKSVTSACKDANGFVRPCTQVVSTGDIGGYTCPKTMDVEIVQLGLFQLDLLESYPYPEDRAIRVQDETCDDARARATQNRTKLDELTKVTP